MPPTPVQVLGFQLIASPVPTTTMAPVLAELTAKQVPLTIFTPVAPGISEMVYSPFATKLFK